MATDTSMDVGILEKIGDAFNAFSERTVSLLTKLMGSSNERTVRNLGLVRSKDPATPYRIIPGSLLERMCSLEPQMQALSDDDLKGMKPKLRERLKNGETLEGVL